MFDKDYQYFRNQLIEVESLIIQNQDLREKYPERKKEFDFSLKILKNFELWLFNCLTEAQKDMVVSEF